MSFVAKFWPLSDIHMGSNCASAVYSSKPLYRLAVEAVIRNFSNNPRCPNYRATIEELPLGVRLDMLAEMCDYPSLVEVQLQVLSDPLLVSDFIRHLSGDLTPLVHCIQWLLSVKKHVPMKLYRQYKKLTEEKISTGGYARLDYRCGLRIGTFLIEIGWTCEAIGVLQLAQQQACFGSAEELAVLRQLLRAETLAGAPNRAKKTYDRMERMLSNIMSVTSTVAQSLPDTENELQSLRDLQAAVFHSFSLYHFEDRNVHRSHECGMESLTSISTRSPSRLVIDVLRQLVRACLGCRLYTKAVFTLKLAFGLVVQDYGRMSALYAETLEDLAILLLACKQTSESVEVYAEAQHIYTQLYGSRNLRLFLAQGNLAYGLCLQAYLTGSRKRALLHIAKSVGNYKRNLPPQHRLLQQILRSRATVDLFKFPDVPSDYFGDDEKEVELFNHKEIVPLSPCA
uniref:Uncharacterized protein n=1 Tax=Anopheles minimus TaxID=112268 RepID=A0A182VT91_9DIPT